MVFSQGNAWTVVACYHVAMKRTTHLSILLLIIFISSCSTTFLPWQNDAQAEPLPQPEQQLAVVLDENVHIETAQQETPIEEQVQEHSVEWVPMVLPQVETAPPADEIQPTEAPQAVPVELPQEEAKYAVIAGNYLPQWFIYTCAFLVVCILFTMCFISTQRRRRGHGAGYKMLPE